MSKLLLFSRHGLLNLFETTKALFGSLAPFPYFFKNKSTYDIEIDNLLSKKIKFSKNNKFFFARIKKKTFYKKKQFTLNLNKLSSNRL